MGNELNNKFKVGDKVRFINNLVSDVDILGQVGVIVHFGGSAVIDMGKPRRSSEPNKTCWYCNVSALDYYVEVELEHRIGEQLEFEFMNK